MLTLLLRYIQGSMTAIILFSCTGLLVYWTSRVCILMHGSAQRVNRLLEADLLWAKAFIGFQ